MQHDAKTASREKGREKNGRPGAERPEEDAGKKSVAVTIVRILLFIVIVCMSLFFYAIRTGRIDVQLIRYAEKDLSPARRNVDSLDEHFDRKSESAITNASELIALGQRCSRINDVGDAQAAVYFRKAAELGSPVGQYLLAGMYDEGRGVLQNREKALALYLQAAEQGYGEAQNKLGEMYEKGDGVAQDMAQAVVWYRKAAELRSDNAQMKLGLLLITGQGVPRDTEQGLDLLQQLVERNNKDAMFALACLYDTGDGVEQDRKKRWTCIARWRNRMAAGMPTPCLPSGVCTTRATAWSRTRKRRWTGSDRPSIRAMPPPGTRWACCITTATVWPGISIRRPG